MGHSSSINDPADQWPSLSCPFPIAAILKKDLLDSLWSSWHRWTSLVRAKLTYNAVDDVNSIEEINNWQKKNNTKCHKNQFKIQESLYFIQCFVNIAKTEWMERPTMHSDPVVDIFFRRQLHNLLQIESWVKRGICTLVEFKPQRTFVKVLFCRTKGLQNRIHSNWQTLQPR